MQWLILSFSVIWEVDIQNDDESEGKKYDKDICAKKLRQRSVRWLQLLWGGNNVWSARPEGRAWFS